MGAAGDMLMGALYELLSDEQKKIFLDKMNSLFPEAISVQALGGAQCGITGTHMQVLANGEEEHAGEDGHEHHHHHDHDHDHEHHHDHDHDHEHHHDHDHDHDHEHHHHDHDHDHEHHHHDHDHDHEHHHHHDHDHEHEHHHHHDHGHGHHHHYSYHDILHQISHLDLTEDVKEVSGRVYRHIGEAEAKVHGATLENIHFHEVGSLDAVADVVGNALLLSMIAPDKIVCSPIHVGNGTVHCAHGVLPVPAPATAEILKGMPWYQKEIMTELCTPTGAALLKEFATEFASMPEMIVEKTGIGLGTKEFPVANVVRVFLGEEAVSGKSGENDTIIDFSCNLDDMTGEALGYCMEVLLAEGALDVYYQGIQMKKNRPGVLLHCLCEAKDQDKFAQLILKHTTTRGVRYTTCNRYKLQSHTEEITTNYGPLNLKVSEGYGVKKSKLEYEDLKKLAIENGLSLEELKARL